MASRRAEREARIYQHAIPSMIEEAGDRLDEIVFSRRRAD
jgi:hypothetical protein